MTADTQRESTAGGADPDAGAVANADVADVDHGIDIRIVVAIIILAILGAIFLNLLATGML